MKKVICLLVCFTIICTSIYAFAAESKSKQAPVINYTLSETEETWNPITVTLDITDDEEIVDVRYVRATSGRMYDLIIDESIFVPYDIDCKSLFMREYGIEDDELEKVFGTVGAGCVVESYYLSAFESYYNEKDELVYKDKSMPVENGEFSVCYNDLYIIYAEDKTGNKAFKMFDVRNIKQASAEVDINNYSDFSGEYIAEAKLNVTENPNALVKNIYLYKDIPQFMFATGALSDFIKTYSKLIESVQRAGCMIPSVDEGYCLRGFGKYNIIFEDEWGGFSKDSFVFSPSGTDTPEFDYELHNDENNVIEVKIIPRKNNIAKLEYVKVTESSMNPIAEHEFERALENKRVVIQNNSFIAEPHGRYAVRALSTDGCAAYKMVDLSQDETDEYDINNYEIKSLLILSASGEALTVPPQNKSFTVEVTACKNNNTGYLILAVYGKNGALLYTNRTLARLISEHSYEFNIPAINNEIGEIKAFVWSDSNYMIPLAYAKALEFQR